MESDSIVSKFEVLRFEVYLRYEVWHLLKTFLNFRII